MKLFKSLFTGLILAGMLAMMPAAAIAHGGGGGGGGGHSGGGGGHGFAGGHGFGGGGHAFGGFSGRGVSREFNRTRGSYVGRFVERGDHGRFDDHGVHGRDRDHRHNRFRDFDGDFADFGYPDYSYDYADTFYDDNGYVDVQRVVQERLAELGYYHGPVDGAIGPETERAIGWFQSVAKIPVSGRLDGATLRALQIN